MDIYFLNGLLSGLCIAVLCGIVGCILLWQRLIFLGDVLGHGALLGVSLGALSKIGPTNGVLLIGSLFVFYLTNFLKKTTKIPADAWLALFSYTSLSLGLLVLFKINQTMGIVINPMSYLFGDILLVSTQDVFNLFVSLCIILMTIKIYWKKIVLIALDSDHAHVMGISIPFVQLISYGAIVFTICFAMKTIGALLVPALLVMPPACASTWAQNPLQMIFYSTIISVLSVLLGFLLAYQIDLPVGASIIICASFIFGLSRISKK